MRPIEGHRPRSLVWCLSYPVRRNIDPSSCKHERPRSPSSIFLIHDTSASNNYRHRSYNKVVGRDSVESRVIKCTNPATKFVATADAPQQSNRTINYPLTTGVLGDFGSRGPIDHAGAQSPTRIPSRHCGRVDVKR